MVFGTVNKIFLAYERPFLNPDISEIIVLWNKVEEESLPMGERWFKKIYSFCKGEKLRRRNRSQRVAEGIEDNK